MEGREVAEALIEREKSLEFPPHHAQHPLKVSSYRLADVTACQKLHNEKLKAEQFIPRLGTVALKGARLAFQREVSIFRDSRH
jgi:hypothetical protein